MGPLIVSLKGTQILDKEKWLLQHNAVGGLVLFKENWQEEADDPISHLKEFIRDIRLINPTILIMIDHEGGEIWRFHKGFTKLPAAKTFGATYEIDPKKGLDDAFSFAKIMASELKACDIDLSLAPILDLDGINKVIGGLNRAFHEDPKVVSKIAEAFINGMQAGGMAATGKHFPGHGSCLADSHLTTPRDERPLSALEKDLEPFKDLIRKKLLAAIMPAYVIYDAVDPQHTAGLSRIWLQNYLREKYHFEGVIMSDCLSMEGAKEGNNVDNPLERLIAAKAAGCDFLMLTHQHDNKLDKLLNILDQIPDSIDSKKRRIQFTNTTRGLSL